MATIAARNFVDKKPESTLMQSDSRIYSLPRWRVTRWLADCGADVPEDIRVALIGNLYGTLPVFIGGILNTLLVAAAIAARSPTPLFIAWLARRSSPGAEASRDTDRRQPDAFDCLERQRRLRGAD